MGFYMGLDGSQRVLYGFRGCSSGLSSVHDAGLGLGFRALLMKPQRCVQPTSQWYSDV